MLDKMKLIGHGSPHDEVAALKAQLAAKDAEIERLKVLVCVAFLKHKNKPIPLSDEGWNSAWETFKTENNL